MALKFKILGQHRKLALWSACAVFIWAMSGLLHPLMSWTNPRPVSFMPPKVEAFATPTLNQVKNALRTNDYDSVSDIRILGNVLQTPDVLIDIRTRDEIPDGLKARAIDLARYYTGNDGQVRAINEVTKFSDEYPYINRYLPAWRVKFDDDLNVYVDLSTDRLGSLTTKLKVVLQTLFENIHTFKFLQDAEALRLIAIGLLVASIPGMAVMGIYIRATIRRETQGPRRKHRILTMLAVIPLLMFSISGLFHLVMQSPLIYRSIDPVQAVIAVQDIKHMPRSKSVTDLRLIMDSQQTAWWRMQDSKGTTYMNALTGDTLQGDENFAVHLAQTWSGDAAILSAIFQTAFSSEYGFANKRLPVWRIETTHEILFVEPRTATLAAKVTRAAAAETWSFSNFHKWQFVPNRIARDVLQVLAVFLVLGAVFAGLRLRR